MHSTHKDKSQDSESLADVVPPNHKRLQKCWRLGQKEAAIASRNVFMRSVVFCVGGCLSVLLDASIATAAIIVSLTVTLHLFSLDVAGM